MRRTGRTLLGPELHRLDQPVHQRLSHVLVRKAHHGDHHQGVEGVRLGLPEGGLVDLPLRVLDPGDGTRAGLWLEGITHKGLNGGTITTPEVTFSGIQMPNRVDAGGSDWALAMNWHRVNLITLETGGQIFVTYKQPQCVRGSVMPSKDALDKNKLLCYPVEWAPNGRDKVTDFFHKYVVEEVQQIDHTGRWRIARYVPPTSTRTRTTCRCGTTTRTTASPRPTARRGGSGAATRRSSPTSVRAPRAPRPKPSTSAACTATSSPAAAPAPPTVEGLEGGAVNDYDHYRGAPLGNRSPGSARRSCLPRSTTMWRSDPPSATRSGTPIAEARYARVKDGQDPYRRRAAVSDVPRPAPPTTATACRPAGSTTVATTTTAMKTLRQDRVSRATPTGTNWLLTPCKRTHG